LTKATSALRIGLINWAAWAVLIGAALAFDSVIALLMFFGIFYALASVVSCLVGIVLGLLALRADDRGERRKAWTGILLILLLWPTLWLGFRFGYGSVEWTEEVRLAGGDVIPIHRKNLNGPGDFLQKCRSCVSQATFSGEHRGRRFEWSTDRATISGSGPLALEFVDGNPLLVFEVSGKADCAKYGQPDPPFRVIRLERRGWLPDRWVEADFAEVPHAAQVNLLGIHRVPRLAEPGGKAMLTAVAKDQLQDDDGYTLAPHGARLSAVGEWLAADPDSCRHRGRSPSDAWLNAKRAVLDSESRAGAVTAAELIERRDETIILSAEQVRAERGVTGPISRTRGCRDLGVRVSALGNWVAGIWQNAGGELQQSDVLVSPVGSGDERGFWVLPGPIQDYRQIVCLPGEVLVVRSKEPGTYLLTRLGGPGATPVSRSLAVDVPDDLEGQATYFWTLTDDGREIQVVTYQGEQNLESGRMVERNFDKSIEYRGVRLSTLLRYRVP
jgi:hypothetical protein